MKLTVCLPSFEYMVESMAQFQSEEAGAFFRESLYLFYPKFDRERMDRLDQPGRKAYLRDILDQVYREALPQLRDKAASYQAEWERHAAVVQAAFEDLFSLKLDGALNDMTANVTLNPVCPRYLDTHSFDLFYWNSPAGALGLSLHEMVHFLWFRVWRERFQDNPKDYETPHLKWVLSEAVVDLFLNDPRLRPLNPYLTEDSGTIYAYFHAMTAGGRPLLEQLGELFRHGGVEELMERGYALLLAHEPEIRAAMG